MSRNVKFFLMPLLFSFSIAWGTNTFQNNLQNFFYAQISLPMETVDPAKLTDRVNRLKIDLNAKSAFLIRISPSGREKVFLKKNIDQVLGIASLTKLMTALVILENPENYAPAKIITVSKTAAKQDKVPNYGNLKTGEKLSVKKLLDLMLIYSSNHAAFALAEYLGLAKFTEQMNQKTKALNLADTAFLNPTGLDPEGLRFEEDSKNFFNRSSAKDILTQVKYILKNHPSIFEISAGDGPYSTANGIKEVSLPKNTIIIGGKTGYTDETGGSMLLLLSDEKGAVFVGLILGAPSAEERVQEMQKLTDLI